MLTGEEQAQAIRHLLGGAACIEVTAANNPAIPPPLRVASGRTESINGHPPDVVGIRCGPTSQYLVAIGFRSIDALQVFTSANSGLKNCPVTRWENWSILWIRTDFADKKNIEAGDMLWICQGIVPLGWLANDTGDIAEVLQQGEPQSIPYANIVWPQGFRGGFRLPYFKFLYGSPIIRNGRRTTLNASLWAGWLADQLEVRFDTRVGAFRQLAINDGTDGILGSATIKEMVAAFLRAAAAQDAKGFPLHEIRPNKIGEIVELMKLTNPVTSLTEEEALQEFFRVAICNQPGANITNEELWEAYSNFCKSNRVPAYPKCEFRTLSIARVRETFGKTCVHSILRNGHSKRGYNDLALLPGLEKPLANGAASIRPGKKDQITSAIRDGLESKHPTGGSTFHGKTERPEDTRDGPDGEDGSIGDGQPVTPNFCHIPS